MAVLPSTKSSTTPGTPALIPQGEHSGKTTMPMGRVFTLVGSRQRAHLHLLSRSISKVHAVIVNDAGNLYIRDTASREHVYVNGQLVREAELRNGDLVKIGSFTFKLSDPSGKSGRALAPETAPAALQLAGTTMPALIEGHTWLIGRRPTCDLVLGEMAVSTVHAVIFENRGRHEIRDLGSRTGTFVNGQQVHQQPLEFNDQIRIGDHEFHFVSAGVELDELEHLIGTATLGVEQVGLAKADAARVAAEEPVAHDEDSKLAAAASSADLTELDLNADPDVSGSGDTRAIPLERLSDTPRVPVLSSQVVDDGLDDELGIETQERRLLIGADLHEEKLTPTGNFVNVEPDEAADHPPDADLELIPLEFEPPVAHAEPAHEEIAEPAGEKDVDGLHFDPAPPAAEATAAPMGETSDELLAWANAIIVPDEVAAEPAAHAAAGAAPGPDVLTAAEHLELMPAHEPQISPVEHLDAAPIVETQPSVAGEVLPAEHVESTPMTEPQGIVAAEELSPGVEEFSAAPDVLTAAEHIEPAAIVESQALVADEFELLLEVVEAPATTDLLTTAEHLNLASVVEPEMPMAAEHLDSTPVDEIAIRATAEHPAIYEVSAPAENVEPALSIEPAPAASDEVLPALEESPAGSDMLTDAEHFELLPIESETPAHEVLPEVAESPAGSDVLTDVEHFELLPIESETPAHEVLPEVAESSAGPDVPTDTEHLELLPIESETPAHEMLPEVAEFSAGPDVLTTAEHLELAPAVEIELPAAEGTPATLDAIMPAEHVEPAPSAEPQATTMAHEASPAAVDSPAGSDVLPDTEHFELLPIESETPAHEVLPEVAESCAGPDVLTSAEHFELLPIESETPVYETSPAAAESPAGSDVLSDAEHFELLPIEPETPAHEASPEVAESHAGPDVLTSAEHFELLPIEPETSSAHEALPEVAETSAGSDVLTAAEHLDFASTMDSEAAADEDFLPALDEPVVSSGVEAPSGHVEPTPNTEPEIPVAGEFLSALDESASISAVQPSPEPVELSSVLETPIPAAGEFLAALDESAAISHVPAPVEHVEPQPALATEFPRHEEFLTALDEPAASVNGEDADEPAHLTDSHFGDAVPPPFPAGMVPELGIAAVGIPGWNAIRAQTARHRIPTGEDTPQHVEPTLPAHTFAAGREVLAATDPTPESAQHLETEIGDTWAPAIADVMPLDSLSDTHFDLVMQDFAGAAAGPLIEHDADNTSTYAAPPLQIAPINATGQDSSHDLSRTTAMPAEGEQQLTSDEASALAAGSNDVVADLPLPMDAFNPGGLGTVDDLSHVFEIPAGQEEQFTDAEAWAFTAEPHDVVADSTTEPHGLSFEPPVEAAEAAIVPEQGTALDSDEISPEASSVEPAVATTDVQTWDIHSEPAAVDEPSHTSLPPAADEHHLTSDQSAVLTAEPQELAIEPPAQAAEAAILPQVPPAVHSQEISPEDSSVESAAIPAAESALVDQPSQTTWEPAPDAHHLTADESTAVMDEPHGAALESPAELHEHEASPDFPHALDAHDGSADVSDTAYTAAEMSLSSEDILAHEGLLPEFSGDEMVDQAMAFLKHEGDSPDHEHGHDQFLMQAPEEENPTPRAHRPSPMLRMSDDSAQEAVAQQAVVLPPAASPMPANDFSVDTERNSGPALDNAMPEHASASIAREPHKESIRTFTASNDVVSRNPVPSAAIPARNADDAKMMTAALDLTELDDGLIFEDEAPASDGPSSDAPSAVVEKIEQPALEQAKIAVTASDAVVPDQHTTVAAVQPEGTDLVMETDHPGFAPRDENEVPATPVAPVAAVQPEGTDLVMETDHPGFAPHDENEVPATPVAPIAAPVPPSPQRMSMNSLLGLSRDFGSFLGGTPLTLGPGSARRPAAAPQSPQAPAPASAPNATSRPQGPGPQVTGAQPPVRPAVARSNSLEAIANSTKPENRSRQGRPVFGDVPVTSTFVGDATEILQPFNPAPTDISRDTILPDAGTPRVVANAPAASVQVSSRTAASPRVSEELPVVAPVTELLIPETEDQTLSDEDPGLEWETHDEADASAPVEMHPEGEKLFDSAPDALDDLPDTLEPIGDVIDVVDDESSPVPSGSAPAASAPMNGGLPVLGAESNGSPRKTAGGEKTGAGSDVMGRPKRMTPPPPARSLARRAGSSPSPDASIDPSGGEPGIPPIDVFSQPQASGSATGAPPEIPPAGFIPPGSGPGSRRGRPPAGRPPRPGSNGESAALPGKSKGPRKPAVVEAMNPDEDELPEDSDDTPTHEEKAGGSPNVPKRKAKKRWRFPFMGLFLLIIAVGGGGAAAWYKMPHSADLRATMRFEKLDQLSGRGRSEFEKDQHQKMAADDFRLLAQKIYLSDFHGRPGDGFLFGRSGGNLDLRSIVDASQTEGDRLVFNLKDSRDPAGDRIRFQAVLKSLYATDIPMRDDAASRRTMLESTRAELAQTENRLAELQQSIQSGQKTQADFEAARKTEKDLSDRFAKLEKVWSDASAEVRKIRAGIEAAPVAPAPLANDDSDLQQMTARLKQLNDAVDAARGAHSGDAHSAAAALDAALAAYQKEIDTVKAATTGSSTLGSYLATAQQVEAAIHQINQELVDREKLSGKTVSDLHGKIAEKIEAHLKRVWASDPQLLKLTLAESAHEHRLGAAVSAGLTDDAVRIRGEIEIAKAAVATRRDQVALSANYPDEIKALEKLVSDQSDQMRGERARAGQRMAEQFKLLAAAAPAPGTLSDDQQKLMDGLVDNLVAVSTARQQLTQVSATDGGADVKSLESDATELKAQIEARRHQLADAAGHATPVPDSPAVLQQRANLALAQQAEARAFSDWTSSKTDLAQAQSVLDRLQSKQPDLVRDNAAYATAQARHDSLKQQLEVDGSFVPVIPIDPNHEDAVQLMRSSDNRMPVEIGIGAAFVICAAGLMFFGGRRRDVADRSIERLSRGNARPAVGRRAVTAGAN